MAEPEEKSEEGQEKPSPGSTDSPSNSLSPTAKRMMKRREERLALIRQQVDEGTLTIRQMTPEERAKNPPRPRRKKNR